MSERTTSAPPPLSIASSVSCAVSSRTSRRTLSTPAIGSLSTMLMATTSPRPPIALTPLPAAPERRAALRRDLAPAAGRGAEVHDPEAGPKDVKLVVDLLEFEGGARAKSLALGGGNIGIIELPLEPPLRRGCAAPRLGDANA